MFSLHLLISLVKGILFFITFSLIAAVPGLIWDYFRFKRLARKRASFSICQFTRSLDYRQIDTRIIRVVYEGVQGWTLPGIKSFPVVADDDIYKIYGVQGDLLEDLAKELADKSGRSWENAEHNPLYGSVFTVKDMILFLNQQPRLDP